MPATAAIDNETLDHLLSAWGLLGLGLVIPVLRHFRCSPEGLPPPYKPSGARWGHKERIDPRRPPKRYHRLSYAQSR